MKEFHDGQRVEQAKNLDVPTTETDDGLNACQHEDVYYYLAATHEDGWTCADRCGEKLGFRPDLDRTRTEVKVNGILHGLHEQGFIYVSNGSIGEGLTARVVEMCRERGYYDQYSIAQYIFELMTPSHAEFWKNEAFSG